MSECRMYGCAHPPVDKTAWCRKHLWQIENGEAAQARAIRLAAKQAS